MSKHAFIESAFGASCGRCGINKSEHDFAHPATLDAQIDALHGAGAARILDDAIADGSVFGDSSQLAPSYGSVTGTDENAPSSPSTNITEDSL